MDLPKRPTCGEGVGAMPSPIHLRPATCVDIPALVRLLRRSWLVAWAPELPFEAVLAFARHDPAKTQAEREWPSFIVATRDDVVLGMSRIVEDVIEDLNVDPSAWGEGVGSHLMDQAETRIATTHAWARLEVRAFNRRAQAFYRRRGWIEHSRYPGFECGSPVENVEMRKALKT